MHPPLCCDTEHDPGAGQRPNTVSWPGWRPLSTPRRLYACLRAACGAAFPSVRGDVAVAAAVTMAAAAQRYVIRPERLYWERVVRAAGRTVYGPPRSAESAQLPTRLERALPSHRVIESLSPRLAGLQQAGVGPGGAISSAPI